jgi:hypothetical protein
MARPLGYPVASFSAIRNEKLNPFASLKQLEGLVDLAYLFPRHQLHSEPLDFGWQKPVIVSRIPKGNIEKPYKMGQLDH